MANDYSVLVPKLLAQGLDVLRNAAFMPAVVNRGYEREAGQLGSSVVVPIPSTVAVRDVAPGVTPTAAPDQTPTSVSVPLDQWREAPFYLTDKEELEVMEGTIPMLARSAIASLADDINQKILALYKSVYGYVGTAGATPFVSDTTDATGLRKVLHKQLCPDDGNRHVVLDPDAEANAINLRAFQDVSWGNDASVIRDGKVGNKLGFMWHMHQLTPTHTAGTITTGLIAKAATAQAVGLKAITCTTAASTGACALKKGDIITFAGQTQTYVVTADATQASAATDVTVNIYPGLKTALAGSEAVSVKSSHVVNLGFHRDAFAFASRPLKPINGFGGMSMNATDPVSGLTLRLEVTRQNKQMYYSYDVLFGVACVRPELAARLAG